MGWLRMNVITKHMIDDENAVTHAHFGLGSFVLASVAFALGFASFYWVLTASLIMGVAIELVQRVQRAVDWRTFKWLGFTGEHQNSFKESVLDVMQTWLFTVTYYVNRNKP
jgi:hypothetical protein